MSLGRRSAIGRLLGIGAGAAMAPQVLQGMPANVPTSGLAQWVGDTKRETPLSAAAQLLRDEIRAKERRFDEAYAYRNQGVDPDIACLRSVSWSSKVRMQRQRHEEHHTLKKALWEQFHKAAGWS